MKLDEFKRILDRLAATNSRKEKQTIISEIGDSPAAISFLSGSEFDDAGLGKKTVLSVAQDVFGDDLDGQPTVSEELAQFDGDGGFGVANVWVLREDMAELADLSGNEQKEYLQRMFESYHYPSIVAHACLNDWPTGVGDSTIATALGLKDSLPFVEGVVEAAEMENPPTSPQAGEPFEPMLAKSESSLPDDVSDLWVQPKLDGYRLLIHVLADGTAKAYTRRMNDVTESLPELNEICWENVARPGPAIFDAEVIAKDGTYKSTSERVGRDAENVERDVEMEFALFDILMVAGQDISHKSYHDRYNDLWGAPVSGEYVYKLEAHDYGRAAARALGQDHEGVIWKDPDAPYRFGKRSSAWVKSKNTAETVDVRAAGFSEGEGRLSGTLGKIHLVTADGHPVGATGSGFTDEQRDEVWQNRDEYLGEPLEIEAEAFGAQQSLRFPIFIRWRSDDGKADTLDRIENVLPKP
jgi:ATP-dependent DNA ligase